MADPIFDPPPSEPAFGEPAIPTPIPPSKLRPTFPPVAPPKPAPAPAPAPAPLPAAPHEPGNPEALPDLGILALLIVVLGLIALAAALVDLFKWLFRFMLGPLASKSRAATLTPEKLTQPLSNYLSGAYAGVDGYLGVSFTKLGAQTGRLGRVILGTEQNLYAAVAKLARLEGQQAGLHDAGAATNQRLQTVQHTAVTAATSAATEHARATATEDALIARLRALETHITQILEPELEALRHRIPVLENGQAVQWVEIKKHEEGLGIGALTAATAVALGRLGADWTSCESGQAAGQAICGAGVQNMRNLLNLLVAGGILLDLKAYVRLEQSLVRPVTETVATLLRVSV